MVVFNLHDGHLGLPIGGDEADLGGALHDGSGGVGQLMEYGGIRTIELCFNGVFLEHQVVAFQLDVGLGVVGGEVGLYLVHIIH